MKRSTNPLSCFLLLYCIFFSKIWRNISLRWPAASVYTNAVPLDYCQLSQYSRDVITWCVRLHTPLLDSRRLRKFNLLHMAGGVLNFDCYYLGSHPEARLPFYDGIILPLFNYQINRNTASLPVYVSS